MLTRIRNANQMRNKEVSMPVSKIKVEIAKILDAEGFITNYTVKDNTLTLTLKYGQNKERVITGLKRISKPGLRVYAGAEEIPHVLNGLGIAIISTPKGVMTDKLARKNNVGGEVIAYIW
jgi:small subunit ribosomal protein S8